MKLYLVSERPILTVFLSSLLITGLFFLFYNNHYFLKNTIVHGALAHSVLHHGTIAVDNNFIEKIYQQSHDQQRLLDIADFSDEQTTPTDTFYSNDTIGYGLLLSGLWYSTKSMKFRDVQILQLLLFLLSLYAVYCIGLFLFNNKYKAILSVYSLLFFFPIMAMNMQPMRDIWAYYGVVIMLYSFVQFFQKKSYWPIIFGAIAFTVCMWIRPSVVMALVTFTIAIGLIALFDRFRSGNSIGALIRFWLITIIGFWIPFMALNKRSYDRYMVGPVGHDLLAGLGEFDNKWGHRLNDDYIKDLIFKKYGHSLGTVAYDDAAYQEFSDCYHQDRWFYYTAMLKRIPGLMLPGLPWIFHTESPYKDLSGVKEKLHAVVSSPSMLLDFLLRHVYIRLYLLIGYIGILICIVQRKWHMLSLLIIGILFGGLGKLPSHIEYRYIVPYYWVFCFFVAEALWAFSCYLNVDWKLRA